MGDFVFFIPYLSLRSFFKICSLASGKGIDFGFS